MSVIKENCVPSLYAKALIVDGNYAMQLIEPKRTHDGAYQAVADEDENAFTAAKGATFLATVYEPTFTAEP